MVKEQVLLGDGGTGEVADVVDKLQTSRSHRDPKDLSPGEKAAKGRFGYVNSSHVDKQIELIGQLYRELNTLRKLMDLVGIDGEDIRLDGATKFKRGAIEIKRYISNLEQALEKHEKGTDSAAVSGL